MVAKAPKAGAKPKPQARSGAVVVSMQGEQVRVLQAAARGAELVVQRWGAALAGADEDSRAAAVVRALEEAGIPERRVVVCLPAQSLAIRTVHLPPASPDQLPQLVRFEAQRHLPLPEDQLVIGYQVLRAGSSAGALNGGIGTEVLLAVARKSELSRLEQALSAAGVTVEGYGVDALAVTDAYLPVAESLEDGKPQLILAPDGSGVHAQVLSGLKVLFMRFLDAGSGDWIPELRRSVATYSLEHPEAPIGEVVLLGDVDERAVEQAVGLPARHAVQSPAQAGGLTVPADWSALVGLARQGIGLGQYPLRLEPQGWGVIREGPTRVQTALAVLATLAVVFGLIFWQLDRQRAQVREGEEAARLARQVERERKELGTLTRRRDQLREQLEAAGGAAAAPPLEIIRQVSERVPPDVWLTQWSYQAGKPLQLQGSSRSVTGVPAFQRALEGVPGFSRVELGFMRSASINDVPVTQFRIDCALSPTAARAGTGAGAGKPLPGGPAR